MRLRDPWPGSSKCRLGFYASIDLGSCYCKTKPPPFQSIVAGDLLYGTVISRPVAENTPPSRPQETNLDQHKNPSIRTRLGPKPSLLLLYVCIWAQLSSLMYLET